MSTNRPHRKLIRIVACGASKLDHDAPAGELYTSDLTRKAITYATRRGETMILSARYGLVALDETIAPYDLRVEQLTAGERDDWRAMIVEQLADAGALGGVLLVHGGKTYVAELRAATAGTGTVVHAHVETFLQGVPAEVGRRKAFYARDAAA